jgi:hypothetical protein
MFRLDGRLDHSADFAMPEKTPSHLLVVLTVLVIPIAATLVMELAEALVESLGWRIRLGRTGWDLCILGVGSTGAIFTLPGVVEEWGPEVAVIAGIMALLVAISCGLFIIHLRKTKPEHVKGWQSILAVGLGVASLALPWYFVTRSK